MPITGKKPNECFEKFRAHLSPILTQTLGVQHQIIYRDDGSRTRRALIFPTPNRRIRLDGRHGRFFFSLWHSLEVFQPPEEKYWQLTTTNYQYAIYESDGDLDEPLIRWDYISKPAPDESWCKHHVQIGRLDSKAVELPFNGGTLDLNRLHTPTGFVLIEYVLRFLLTDMGVEPANEGWEKVLDGSQETFFSTFSWRSSEAPRS